MLKSEIKLEAGSEEQKGPRISRINTKVLTQRREELKGANGTNAEIINIEHPTPNIEHRTEGKAEMRQRD